MSLTDVERPITKVATQWSMLKVREKPHCYGDTMHDHKKTSGSGCIVLLLACILFAFVSGCLGGVVAEWLGGVVVAAVDDRLKGTIGDVLRLGGRLFGALLGILGVILIHLNNRLLDLESAVEELKSRLNALGSNRDINRPNEPQ
jgi:hypothetical protein